MNLPILSKDDLIKVIGKPAWGDNRLISKLSYISGIEAFDGLLVNERNIEATTALNLIQCPGGLQIQLIRGFKNWSVALLPSQIEIIELEDKDQSVIKKDKSVIGRAAIGGLLLGPVGAIIGGLSGIGSKDVKSNNERLMLGLSVKIDDKDSIIAFSCKFKNRPEVDTFLTKYYSDKLI